MAHFREDLRYALRLLRRSPAFTAVAALSLALGLGANTTIFSIASGFLRRELHAARPNELVYVYRGHHSGLSYQEYRFFGDRVTTLRGLIGERLMYVGIAPTSGDEPSRGQGALVSGNYFATLGVRPAVGRLFAQRDDAASLSPAVVLSERYWRERFSADPAIVGRTIRVNDRPFTVIGVAEPGFVSSVSLWRPDLFIPFSDSPSLMGLPIERFQGTLYVTGRLRTGVSLAEANAELSTIMGQLAQTDLRRYERATIRAEHARGVNAELRGPVTALSAFLMIVVGLVLLTACANVANLLLARGTDRRKEIALRAALGASRGRIVRQMLVESVVLAMLGGVLAVAMSFYTTRLMSALVPSDVPVDLNIAPDATVLTFTLILSIATGLLFGLAPALRATATDLASVMKDGAGARGFQRSRLRSTFLGAQVTMSVVLLVGATLFVRSLLNARTIDAGFDTEHVIDAKVDVSLLQYDPARGSQYFNRLLEDVTRLPQVQSAAYAQIVPLEGSNQTSAVWVKGVAEANDARRPIAYFNTVSQGYLRTLGIPLVAGREFTPDDREGAPPVVIVNETMAKRLWPQESAVGKELSVDGAAGPYARVVGVARDAKYNTLGEEPLTFMYLPMAQRYAAERVLHVRIQGAAAPAIDAIRQLIRELDRSLVPSSVRPIRDDMIVALLPARAGAIVLGTFGALALLLAMVGIYGVTSYAVSKRTKEIGIRTALGARRADVLRLVVGDSMRVVLASAVLGLVLSVVLWRFASSLLYGVSAADPATLASAAIVLSIVALVASVFPARRAASVDPNVALRTE